VILLFTGPESREDPRGREDPRPSHSAVGTSILSSSGPSMGCMAGMDVSTIFSELMTDSHTLSAGLPDRHSQDSIGAFKLVVIVQLDHHQAGMHAIASVRSPASQFRCLRPLVLGRRNVA